MRTAERLEAALKRGADELQARLEWLLRNRPRALKNARRRYVAICLALYTDIERAARRRL